MPQKFFFDLGVWNKMLTLDAEFKKRDEILSVKKVSEIFEIGHTTARTWHWALNNRHIIQARHSEETVAENERVIVLTDIHVPYHDKLAVEAALFYAEQFQPTTVVLLGDVIDFYKISRFIKKPKSHDVDVEISATRKFLEDLRNRFPEARIIYKQGNHEERLEKYIISNAVELYSLINTLLHKELSFKELNIEYREAFFKLGKLWFLHGHEKPAGGDPEYVTNVMFKYVLDHFIVGHFHRSQEKIYRRIDGSTFWGGALGYLAGPMEYAPLNKWNQGLAAITFGRNGTFRAELRTIQDGEIY